MKIYNKKAWYHGLNGVFFSLHDRLVMVYFMTNVILDSGKYRFICCLYVQIYCL